MLKRSIAFMLVISLFSLIMSSCNNSYTLSSTETNERFTRVEIDYYYRPAIFEDYIPFEKMCENATDVIIGNFVSEEIIYKFPEKDEYGHTYFDEAYFFYYVFDVKDALIGDANGQIRIYTTSEDRVAKVSEEKSICYINAGRWYFDFVEDKPNDILLILTKCDPEKYNDDHAYEWIGAPEINLDKFPEAQYYEEPISNHISGIDMDNCTREEFIDYVCSLVKNGKQ